jgi:SAM-dependent methyltransferase
MSYDEGFYRVQASGSRRSAVPVVAVCIDLLHPASVIDIGCGVGTWGAEFKAQGVPTVTGVDGDYVDRGQLQISRDEFRARDLEQPIVLAERYDLAVCLEVGEHLTPERGPGLVEDLTSLAPAVLFSAAVPLQGGTSHINERWQDYWADQFLKHGYGPRDCIRPVVWDNPAVEPWYAQNMLLYISPAVELAPSPAMPLRLVHPGVFIQRASAPLTLSEVRRRTPETLLRIARRMNRRARSLMS